MKKYDATTDPKLKSFIDVSPDSHFPIQNLPYGVFRRKSGGDAHIGVAIGEFVLDLSELESAGLLNTKTRYFAGEAVLNKFMGAGNAVWQSVRERISELLRHDVSTLRDNQKMRETV
ncbi:MAG: fumarylacetoacetase, partial [Calditrichaeota bacterium]|nr:fumarylacetoacetase [Calditrichota bacterium]